jgi:hypothetical protein
MDISPSLYTKARPAVGAARGEDPARRRREEVVHADDRNFFASALGVPAGAGGQRVRAVPRPAPDQDARQTRQQGGVIQWWRRIPSRPSRSGSGPPSRRRSPPRTSRRSPR